MFVRLAKGAVGESEYGACARGRGDMRRGFHDTEWTPRAAFIVRGGVQNAHRQQALGRLVDERQLRVGSIDPEKGCSELSRCQFGQTHGPDFPDCAGEL